VTTHSKSNVANERFATRRKEFATLLSFGQHTKVCFVVVCVYVEPIARALEKMHVGYFR
jgi:hypothetical protein